MNVALTPMLDATQRTAKAVLFYLLADNSGRAGFVILYKMSNFLSQIFVQFAILICPDTCGILVSSRRGKTPERGTV